MKAQTLTQTEKVFTFKWKGYELTALWNGRMQGMKCQLDYIFTSLGKVLIQGNDYCVSPLMYPDSIDACVTLLAFLTTKEGDTDSEYFADYTPEMLAFIRSNDCEMLGLYVYDYENTSDEIANESAQQWFNEHTAIMPV